MQPKKELRRKIKKEDLTFKQERSRKKREEEREVGRIPLTFLR